MLSPPTNRNFVFSLYRFGSRLYGILDKPTISGDCIPRNSRRDKPCVIVRYLNGIRLPFRIGVFAVGQLASVAFNSLALNAIGIPRHECLTPTDTARSELEPDSPEHLPDVRLSALV
jgi:hypothetical protein